MQYMRGIELSRKYFEEFGLPMLEHDFPHLMSFLSVGFVGSGSEHFGFDDEISHDHDFEPGFCIFLPEEDIISRRDAFLLERAYAKLPKEYCGVKRLPISPAGGNRNGVFRTSEFYSSAVGVSNGALDTYAWLHIPDYALSEATNGEVFFDNYGEFTEIRSRLLSMPEDIRLKRLAGNLLLMEQAGQYNFMRCVRHNEPNAARLACYEFVTAALKVFFLLNHKYMPFYKWCFRALRQIENGDEFEQRLSILLHADCCDLSSAAQQAEIIESIASYVIQILHNNELTDAKSADLEAHAYSVNSRIIDNEIRNLHILTAV